MTDAEQKPIAELGRKTQFQRKITKEQVDLIEGLVGKGFTYESIANELQMPISTVAYYAQRFKGRQQEQDDIVRANFRQPRTPERLRKILELVPGIAEGKGKWAEELARANPALLSNPQELYSLALEGLYMTPFAARQVVNAFFSDMLQAGQGQQPPLASGFQTPQQAPQAQGFQFPQYQAMHTPQGVQYVPLPYQAGPQQAVTAQDVQRIIDQQREQEIVEERKPVLGPNGQPVLGPDGQALFTTTRRPVSQATDPLHQIAAYATLFQSLGLVRPPGQASDAQQIAQAVVQAVGPRQDDGAIRMQEMYFKVMAELEANKARMEMMDRYGRILGDRDKQMQELQLQTAIAKAGLKPEEQAAIKMVDVGDKALSKVMDNVDKRMERLENIVVPLAKHAMGAMAQAPGSPPPPAPMPVPFSNSDLAQAAAQASQPVTPAPLPLAPNGSEGVDEVGYRPPS